ncbi:protein TIC236, chloroplastic isoform X1 [Arachis duranensis]|uniref:Protein TIC236, chloroplastic isoform X1 n=1 Tax=Arachis duranensis TaxID=130453 RepID=A0A6P4BH14_ARADU|nr:protein TIC236, chloroplastic isoform X1 [Arachis duranensis]
MSVRNHTPFFGTEIHASFDGNNSSFRKSQRNLFHLDRRNFPKKGFLRRSVVSAKQGFPVSQAFRFPQFCRQNVNLLSRNLGSTSVSRLNCTREPFFRSKVLVNFDLSNLWSEGLMLFRASVYTAVVSGVCILAWYGRNKAKAYVEANLLPSVCLAVSEYIERDLQFGKVRRISPLSITLESCSFGPHKEEFSCGEAPTVKLRLHPFASLRSGKFVVDAVLSQPSLLVVQKKDYTWLGIPPPSEDGLQRHLSTEEGIDYRTRTRRIAREGAVARWTQERDDAAREAAHIGYFVSEPNCDDVKEIPNNLLEATYSKSFFCTNEGKHDHHCMDTGVDYNTKHAALEKSFGVRSFGFFSRIIKGHRKHKFKRKPNKKDICASGVAVKRRILERSGLAAHKFFQDQSPGKFGEPPSSSGCLPYTNHDMQLVKTVVGKNEESVVGGTDNQNGTQFRDLGIWSPSANENINGDSDYLKFVRALNLQTRESKHENLQSSEDIVAPVDTDNSTEKHEEFRPHAADSQINDNVTGVKKSLVPEDLDSLMPRPELATHFQVPFEALIGKLGLHSFLRNTQESMFGFLSGPIEKLKSDVGVKVEDIVAEHVDDVDALQSEGLSKMLPVTLDSVHFRGATVMLLAYGDREAREMENVNGHVKLNNHYSRVNVQLSGNCKTWRSDVISEDGGWLSADVYVDIIEQKWHANLKIENFFVPLFERILEIPVGWSEGRASGEVHLCMSKGENFPNLHGQLDVTGLNFQLLDAPSCFSNISASLCFRGQRIFLHNANGWFGSVPLEASGDFGIHPEEGEFHLMCQVPGVEVNALMRTFKMRPLLFPLAGSVTALFNCQGPLDTPVFVGTGMVSRTFSTLHDTPESLASEALAKSKEAGALAAFDRIPFSYASANFTFNTDNCVADLYGIRATLVDGGEIRGAGNAWLCPEGEEDETAIDVNLSGSLAVEKILLRYLPNYHHQMPLKFGVLNGETKLSGALLRPRFDIKWTAPKAVGSFSDARGDIIISHDFITVNSASAAFDLYMKVLTSYSDDFAVKRDEFNAPRDIPFTVDGIELDLRMRGFEFFSLVSTYTLDFPRPLVLKSTGRIKFHGKVLKPNSNVIGQNFENNRHDVMMLEKGSADSLVGDISISDLKLNQLMLAPQLSGQLRVSSDCIKLDASGRPDESLAVEFVGPLQPSSEDGLINGKLLSISLQKGQLRVNAGFQPFHSANLEVRQFPLDELELASLRGTIQRAEIQLNLQKRRGHGILSVLRPKFSGVLGEALDVAARWSGDVITIEKAALEQSYSHYELQGEYVLPGSRDRNPVDIKGDRFIKKLMSGHLGSFISSMGRWRMKLEVPRAEVAEMLPLARLLSRSTDPAVLSRSKDFFIQGLQTVGLYSANLQQLLELIRGHHVPSQDVVLEDLSLPGLSELKGRWRGSLDASGGGNGDTLAEFDFHGEDWEWGEYKTQRVLAIGAYSNDDGLHLEKIFIQKDNATVHADGTLLGPKTNLHFAVLNFPVSLVPTVVQVIESTATDLVHSLRQLLAPIRGILHMEGDLRGSLAKPECDVQVRLLDGAVGGIDLGRAEIVASLTSTSRFVFNAKLEPIIQNGHVLVQGSIPVAFVQNNTLQQDVELDKSGFNWVPEWVKERNRGTGDDANDKKASRDRNEEDWNSQITESLKGLNWQILDAGEVRVDADIKDGGMMLVTALSPYANWLHGNADVMLEVRGTVDQPVLNGYASFHRASISSPVLRKPLTNFGGTVNVRSNRLSIASLESRVSRKGKLFVKGNLPLRTSEAALNDKIELKCEALEVRAKNILSGQVDSQVQITGSMLQPNISGNIKLSQGEAYLPHDKGDKGGGAASNRFPSNQPPLPAGGVSRAFASRYVSRFFSSKPATLTTQISQSGSSVKKTSQVEKDMEQVQINPNIEVYLSDLKLVLGPELKIVYPLILSFAVSGELELNGLAHPKCIKPRGILAFENGEVDLVATQVRLKREHLNVAKFEPEYGLDPMLDLALVGSEWQFRIQGRASHWQDKLVVTSTHSVEQDALSPTEAARRFESQLAESILEGNGQLAFEKLATATLEKLMPRIEGKGEFGQARWRVVYAPQIPSLVSADTAVDPLSLLTSNISFGTEVEVQLGKRLQASIVRQMKESEMAMQWTLSYQLTSRLRVLLQSAPSKRLLFEYSATSQD